MLLIISNVKIGHVGAKLDNSEYHYGQYGVNYYRTILKKALLSLESNSQHPYKL